MAPPASTGDLRGRDAPADIGVVSCPLAGGDSGEGVLDDDGTLPMAAWEGESVHVWTQVPALAE